MMKKIGLLGFAVLVFVALASGEPIKVHPSNPHYYLFNGRPTLLITSAEHYGAVVNLDFDYVTYLDALKTNGMNYTREWPGAVLEMVGEFYKGNTMGPRPDNGPSCPGRAATCRGMSMAATSLISTNGIRSFSPASRISLLRRKSAVLWWRFASSTRSIPIDGPSLPCITRTISRAWASAISRMPRSMKYPDLVQRESEYVSKSPRK